MADLSVTYRKTPAGVAELAGRQANLTREQRNLLIVADGRHALGIYAKVVGAESGHLASVAESLLTLGLIEPVGGVVPAPRELPPSAEPREADALHQLMALAESVFGDQAGPVLRKLEKAGSSPGELVSAVEGSAKLAKLTIDDRQAGRFLDEAKQLLARY
jgi:hypothetical protein